MPKLLVVHAARTQRIAQLAQLAHLTQHHLRMLLLFWIQFPFPYLLFIHVHLQWELRKRLRMLHVFCISIRHSIIKKNILKNAYNFYILTLQSS